MSDKTLVKAALGQKVDRTPIWFLRQAGRYLPEYREIRAKKSFMQVCQNPELASEVTMQPLLRFDLDAAIIFSDILVPCAAAGQGLSFGKGHGPLLTPACQSAKQLAALNFDSAAERLRYVGEAIALTKARLRPDQTMIGFAGAPLTVACYMIEGQGSRDFLEVKKLMFNDPKAFTELIEGLTEVTVEYMALQKKSGADCFMLFDTWAGTLISEDFRELIIPSLNRIFAAAREQGLPLIYYPGQGRLRYGDLQHLQTYPDVLAIDWRNSMNDAITELTSMGLNLTVQGNLDPATLLGSEEVVRERTRGIMRHAQSARAHIMNVGHGLVPSVPPEALLWVIDEVRKFEQKSSRP
jgi:uroporphyrinogen decarboxylase